MTFFAQSTEVEDDHSVWSKYRWLVDADSDVHKFRVSANERLFITNVYHWQCPDSTRNIPSSILVNLKGTFAKRLLLTVKPRIIVAHGAVAWYWLRDQTVALEPDLRWLNKKITEVYPLGQPWKGHAYRAQWKKGPTPGDWFWSWPIPNLTAAPRKNHDPFPARLGRHKAELARIHTMNERGDA